MVETTREQVVSDGRKLEVLATGPSDGRAFVFHNGTPTAAVAFGPMVDVVTARGLRFVTYSRPGYAGSDPHPGRTVADAAGDVSAIVDHLGIGEFVTAGWSGGGPHALATTALLPDRCRAAATIAGVAPFSAQGLDWLRGMGEENLEEFAAAIEGESSLTSWLEGRAGGCRRIRRRRGHFAR
ncbi:MAG: alpha/beta hydrolase fold protein [Pseudonocardiales bacterium]|nr:alpha/beta hydrolase fold protein [Pseudonocardiales bacterium]